jgi:hypothetical protein
MGVEQKQSVDKWHLTHAPLLSEGLPAAVIAAGRPYLLRTAGTMSATSD